MDNNNVNPKKAQHILVFQQNKSGESKVYGMREHGGNQFVLETISIDEALPTVIDDGREYLPSDIKTDLVLDFLKHPDLSHDLGILCRELGIPVVASGKKSLTSGVLTPPT